MTAGRPLPRAVGDVEIVFAGSGGPTGAGDRTAFAAVAWFVGEVVSDQRSDGHGTHAGGDETSPDGNHDDGTHDDGAHEDGDHGDGCAGGHDDDDGHDGDTGSPPGSGSRVGKRVAVRLVDGGTPAPGNDEIAWRWFYAEAAPGITPLTDWPDTCPKSILAGNLTVLAVAGPAAR